MWWLWWQFPPLNTLLLLVIFSRKQQRLYAAPGCLHTKDELYFFRFVIVNGMRKLVEIRQKLCDHKSYRNRHRHLKAECSQIPKYQPHQSQTSSMTINYLSISNKQKNRIWLSYVIVSDVNSDQNNLCLQGIFQQI